MPQFRNPGAFSNDLRRGGLDYLRNTPTGRYANRGQWLRAAAWCAMLAAAVTGLLTSSGPSGFLWAAFVGLAAFFVLATLCHDAAHGSLARQGWINRIALTFGFGFFGIAGHLWRWRHIRLHHVFPNVEGNDIDGEGSILIRLSPYGEQRWWHRYQAIYAPFLYVLVFAHLAWIDDWRHRAMARRMNPDEFRNDWATAEFLLVKVAHAGLTLGVPWVILQPPFWALIVGYMIFSGIASVLFIIIVAGSHLSEEAEFVSPEDDRIGHDWAEHQVLTSVDWSPKSRLANVLSGGSNAHTAHHLFPEAAHCHNPALSDLVSAAANLHGIHHNVTTFAGMVGSHFRYLHSLGTIRP